MMQTSQDLPKELDSTALVRFQDCDPFGHLNNARFIDYFMNARQDQLQQYYGFSIFEAGRQAPESWVVSKSQIAYVWPATLMEEVIIRTRLIHITESKLVVEGVMLDKGGQRIKAVCWIEFTYISLATGRTATHSEQWMEFFGAIRVDEIYTEGGFDTRVAELKASHRRRAKAEGSVTAQAIGGAG